MPVYHVVLFKLKEGVTPTQIKDFTAQANGLVGQIPGLHKMDVGPPHESTAHRSQGFDMGLVAILDKPETIKVYAEHPAHLSVVHKIREEMCTDTLAYDMVFDS